MNRIAVVLAVIAVLFVLTACRPFPWAHQKCAPHGGLDHMAKIGKSYFGVCKDGKWVSP